MAALVVVLAIVAMIAIGAAIWLFFQQRRSAALHEQFGPEYERTVRETGGRRSAERELETRQGRVAQLELRALSPADRTRFSDGWRAVQAHFVDDPADATAEADRLIGEAAQARGYPMGDFEARAADLSVEHPQLASNYRAAHAIAEANSQGHASTEDLRQAFVYYRSLFDELVEAPQEVR